jgi:hypothetical protein
MLDEIILDEERLFRRVPLNPIVWNFENNRPSSAAFKQSTGTSVERTGDRNDPQIIETFTQKFTLKAILTVSAGYCREIGAYPVYKPLLNENIFHAEIHASSEEIKLKNSTAKKIADSATIVFLNE